MDYATQLATLKLIPTQCTSEEIHFLFTNIFARAPVALAVAAMDDGRLIEANQTFLDLIEFKRDDAIGKTTGELGMWPDRPHRDRRKKNIREKGFEKSEEITIRCQSGHLKQVLVSSQLISVDGRDCALGVGVDITTRKEIEAELELAKDQAEAANLAKSKFLATVSHEIRTPLTAILSLSQLILEKHSKNANLSEDLRDSLERIEKNSHFVVELVSGILDLSKIEAEKLEIHKKTFEVSSFLSETMDSLRCLAVAKHLAFNVDLSGVQDCRVYSDPVRLKQIVNNLVGNAIKFTDEGAINITASLIGPERKRALTIVIEDSGCGIPKNKQNLLFKSFSQVDSSMGRRFGGTGLGLHLARKLARLLDGDVTLLDSDEKEGSVFKIVIDAGLPSLMEKPDEPINHLVDPTSGEIKNLTRPNVLVIEDNRDIQMAVKELLTFEGHRVDVASDGRESISQIMKKHYDVVLMDMHMPGLNGIDATKALRQLGFKGRIIAFSAATQKEDQDRALKAGCDGFLGKPFELEDLLDALKIPEENLQ